MRLIKQNYPTTSGQACIAMLSGKTIDEVIVDMKMERSYKYYEANIKQLLDVLNLYGISHASRNTQVPRMNAVPDSCCLLYIRMNNGNSHWVLYYEQKFYDPEYGILEGEYPHGKVTSYLEIFNNTATDHEAGEQQKNIAAFVDQEPEGQRKEENYTQFSQGEVEQNYENSYTQDNVDQNYENTYVQGVTDQSENEAYTEPEQTYENSYTQDNVDQNYENTYVQGVTDQSENETYTEPEQTYENVYTQDSEEQNYENTYVQDSEEQNYENTYVQDSKEQNYENSYAQDAIEENYEDTYEDTYEEDTEELNYAEQNTGVELIEIDETNAKECCNLFVRNSQKDFIKENGYLLSIVRQCSGTLFPFGIYANGKMVGFVILLFDHENVNPNHRYWIYKFMIDQYSQGWGYGKAALQEIVEYFASNGADAVMVSTLPTNTIAVNMFTRYGFYQTNLMNGEEVVFKLPL